MVTDLFVLLAFFIHKSDQGFPSVMFVSWSNFNSVPIPVLTWISWSAFHCAIYPFTNLTGLLVDNSCSMYAQTLNFVAFLLDEVCQFRVALLGNPIKAWWMWQVCPLWGRLEADLGDKRALVISFTRTCYMWPALNNEHTVCKYLNSSIHFSSPHTLTPL